MARLKDFYKTEVVPALTQQFGYKSPMQVPRIDKIVLNMGVGEAVGDKKILDNAVGDMQKIAAEPFIGYFYGNVSEHGDVSRCPRKSSLFFLTILMQNHL
jgi:hypothetical protein